MRAKRCAAGPSPGAYRDLGGDYYTRRDPQRATKRLVAQLQRLGHTVTLQEAVA